MDTPDLSPIFAPVAQPVSDAVASTASTVNHTAAGPIIGGLLTAWGIWVKVRPIVEPIIDAWLKREPAGGNEKGPTYRGLLEEAHKQMLENSAAWGAERAGLEKALAVAKSEIESLTTQLELAHAELAKLKKPDPDAR